MTAWAEVAGRIDEEDAAGVVCAFAGLPEAQRRGLAPEAIELYRRDHLNAVAGLAVVATGNRADVERLWPGVVARQPGACVEILAERNPAWLEGWVDALCERAPRFAWRVARGLRLRGLYAAEAPAYALAFMAGIGTRGWREGNAVYDRLAADPELLDDELWRAFRTEGGGETSFAAYDKYVPEAMTWSAGLRRLAAEGLVDRQRLIDATVDALSRGYSAFRAGWFVRFHDELEPTDEERRARVDQYLDLLGSPTPQIQAFAVKTIAALDKTEALEEHRLIRSLGPAVLNRAKGTASQALRLVDAAAGRSPEVTELATQVAAEALLHEAPDVQGRALAIVERYADGAGGELRAALASAGPVVAPSLRARLAALAGGDLDGEPGDRPTSPARTWPGSILEAEVLDAAEVIRPIETSADLAIAVARALEHPEEVDEVERAVDGISRLCAVARQEPAAIWAPMRKRAERRLRDRGAFVGRGLAADFAGLVAAWLDGASPASIDPPLTVMGFLSARMHAIAGRAGGDEPRPLLSAPTHVGGWIDPEILVDRFASQGELADCADRVLALLRLAPDGRERALAAAMGLPGVAGAALRFALGGDREKPASADPIWVAAVRARFPGRDAPGLGRAFDKLGAGAARVSRPAISLRRAGDKIVWHHLVVSPEPEGRPPSVLFPTVVMHAKGKGNPWIGDWHWWGASAAGTGGDSEADVRWCATLQPSDLDPFFTEGLARVGNNLDWWNASWEERAFLEPLLDVRTSLSDVAARLLAVALAAKEPGIRGLAADATALVLTDGRLSPPALGERLADAWSSRHVTPRRFTLSLSAAAAASPDARTLVREAVVFGLRVKPHTDAAQILELLHELCHSDGIGVEDDDARLSLASYTTGKAGRLAKSVLAIGP